ncbi:hypothetical protein SCA03_32550 [Streptomyces cacaoi]|uniref:Uncharacterized protein n=1 Tax=Streptomyces cacaoi TaxID=1898 RepID=A0A4Y3QZ66_STRCI|nr:hypothetical protein SCA03_32550 [Streptomyces cacaoi]
MGELAFIASTLRPRGGAGPHSPANRHHGPCTARILPRRSAHTGTAHTGTAHTAQPPFDNGRTTEEPAAAARSRRPRSPGPARPCPAGGERGQSRNASGHFSALVGRCPSAQRVSSTMAGRSAYPESVRL